MKDERSLAEKQLIAKFVYTRESFTVKMACAEAGIDEATMRQWIKEGGWDALKRSRLVSKETQIEQLYKLLEKVNEKMVETNEVNPRDAELAVKYTAAIKNLDTEISLTEILEIGKLFTTWLHRRNKELSVLVVQQFDVFIKQRLKLAATAD